MTAPAMKTTTATVPAVFSSFRRERVDGIMVDLCACMYARCESTQVRRRSDRKGCIGRPADKRRFPMRHSVLLLRQEAQWGMAAGTVEQQENIRDSGSGAGYSLKGASSRLEKHELPAVLFCLHSTQN